MSIYIKVYVRYDEFPLPSVSEQHKDKNHDISCCLS